MILIADGTVQTSGVTVRIKPIGVAEADGAGTTAYSTDGIVLYTPTQAETNYTSFILIAKKSACIPASITIITTDSATPGTVKLAPVTHTSAVIPNVTLVDTTTTNTDMRGTDGANTATPLDASATRTALGLGSANLDTQLADLPTVAEFNARTLVSDDYFVVGDYTAPLDASGTRAALGLATANLDTQLADLPTVAEFEARTLVSADYFVVGDYTTPPTAAVIADAVWDETIADHSTTGSTGAALAAAGGSGDPWATALPGAYGAGTAGYIVGTFIDEAISGIGGGTADWTSDEKEEIRYRLGIDGTATAPSTATGAKLGDVEMTQLSVDSSATTNKTAIEVISKTSTKTIEIRDTTYTFNPVTLNMLSGETRLNSIVGSLSGSVLGKVLGGGSGTITGTGVQAQLPDEAISVGKFSTALQGLWNNLIAMITGSGVTAAFTAKAVENVSVTLTPTDVEDIAGGVADQLLVEGVATSLKQDEILAAIQGSEVIQVASPNVEGNLVLTQGDTYDGIGNPKAQWNVTTDYTDGWVVTLTIRGSDDAVVYTTTGSVDSAILISVDIDAPTGLTMTGCPGQWQGKFDVELTKATSVKTIANGVCYINEDQTR